jgi:hypothetical protein
LEPYEIETLAEGNPSRYLITKIEALLPFDKFDELTATIESESEKAWETFGEEVFKHNETVVTSYLEWRLSNSDMSLEADYLPRWPYATDLIPHLLENVVLCLANLDPDVESILCFAGYGRNDLLPSLYRVSTFSVFGDLVQSGNVLNCAPSANANYLFLGQKDALENLMNGYDETIVAAFRETERRMSEIRNFVSHESTKIRRHIADKTDNSETYEKIGSRNLERPLRTLISSTPLKNLGSFAGSLVSIQAAFATITEANPSVGGSIDIATINLSSGFTWMKHKK